MGLLLGTIKLSYRQAEGRHVEIAALCLKYVISAAAAAAIFVLWVRNHGAPRNWLMLACAGAAGIFAIYFRTALHEGMYLFSRDYLRLSDEAATAVKGRFRLLCWGTAYTAAIASVWMLLLLPSAMCFRSGAISYALSGSREQFMMAIIASFGFLGAGVLFAVVVCARLGCAEYLFFSGECDSVLSALDCSWMITREGGGELLVLTGMSAFCGIGMAALCRQNFAEKLARQYALQAVPAELVLGWRRGDGGEQRVELFPAR